MTALSVALGTFAIVSFAVSALVSMTWCLLSRILSRVTPAAEARLLLLIVLSPVAFASFSQFIFWEEWSGDKNTEHAKEWNRSTIRSDTSFSGVWSINLLNITVASVWAADHEKHGEHEEHNEHHRQPSRWSIKSEYPGGKEINFSPVMFVICILSACALISRFIVMLMRTIRAIKTSIETERLMRDVATVNSNGILVLPTKKPEAFVVGIIQPKLFASEGLLRMPKTITQAVLAHEYAHIRRLDPLRHLLVLLACTFHLPGIATHLQKRTQQVQELSADADAAAALGDSTYVAEALVVCARFHHDHNTPHLAFGGGDLEERVRTLIDGHRTFDHPQPWLVILMACIVVYIAVRYSEFAHHKIAHHIVEGLLIFFS